MECTYKLKNIVSLGTKPMAMNPDLIVEVYLLKLYSVYNSELEIHFQITGESIFGRTLLDKVSNNEIFEITIK